MEAIAGALKDWADLSVIRRGIAWVLCVLGVAAVVYGVFRATRSPLFTVQVVEVELDQERPRISSEEILELAAVPVGETSLFRLDLEPIEKRLLKNWWVRSVLIEKRFPQTLGIKISFREPVAVFQADAGKMVYLDSNGELFGSFDLKQNIDVPLITGIRKSDQGRIQKTLQLLEAWTSSGLSQYAQISSVGWDWEKGFTLAVSYSTGEGGESVRTLIDLGAGEDTGEGIQFSRLLSVFRYLSDHSVRARQIFADLDKKIVVRAHSGS